MIYHAPFSHPLTPPPPPLPPIIPSMPPLSYLPLLKQDKHALAQDISTPAPSPSNVLALSLLRLDHITPCRCLP